ncbi:DUF4291 domain-containing protein [Acidovorax sp.]|uniref:DUF4291 domain-containing protein n=1 Tax=Acidovorax sp. TaxID=1872122 RepID=UPI002608D980|nr:DUF4291 domain-containing protein [Acidovorax sp.]
MKLEIRAYQEQRNEWPADGCHVLAHYDANTVVVYQAYRPSIAEFAIRNGRFGGPDFSFTRMSWIKPNFLWMMYRSGWATKEGQEYVLGLRLPRIFFDGLLKAAVSSTFDPEIHANVEAWRSAVAKSEIRSQWDPDHSPSGEKESRRAIQLGLRGWALQALACDELLEVIDMTPFVRDQRAHAQDANPVLLTPLEAVYPWPGHQ